MAKLQNKIAVEAFCCNKLKYRLKNYLPSFAALLFGPSLCLEFVIIAVIGVEPSLAEYSFRRSATRQ
jgi:hypothetical protein